MKVTEKDVAYVADLANLDLTAQERHSMLKDLNSILDYIDLLNKLDTTDVPPMAQISPVLGRLDGKTSSVPAQAWREDTLVPSLPHDQAMKYAPETDGEFFKVPKVIEK